MSIEGRPLLATRRLLRRWGALIVALMALGLGLGRPAHALGLGDLEVSSALGESLRATIRLSGARPAELATLQVRVAPPEAYRALGIPYGSALRTLRLEIEARGGDARIRASSTERLREPVVQLLVEATWEGGRALREYALVLSPR